MLRGLSVFCTLLFFFTIAGRSQAIPGYYTNYDFLMTSPAAYGDGLAGFVNPANLNMVKNFDGRFYWSNQAGASQEINDWGIFAATHGLGFGALRHHVGSYRATDYHISTGFGSQGWSMGLGYGWSSGEVVPTSLHEKMLITGAIIRPLRFISLGLIGNFSVESNAKEGAAEIGIRPLGTPRLTLFADGALQKQMRLSDAPWSAGGIIQLVEGIHVVGRYFDGKAFTLGLSLNLGKVGGGMQSHFNSDNEHAYDNYMVRIGGMQPSFFPTLIEKNRRYLAMNLRGQVGYLRYVLFDKHTHTLLDIINQLKAASQDPRIGIIAVNLSSVQVSPEVAWEIRQELKNAQAAGKKVVAFIDRAQMTIYHLASVADIVVMDPQGDIMLPGLSMGRTYLKGTLHKLGLNFDAWRYFKYKSAAEVLSRDDMSEPDREQRQAFIDDWYNTIRADVCASRKFSTEKFDQMVNNEVFYMPEDAVRAGLADTLARWDDLNHVINKLAGEKMWKMPPADILQIALPSQRWGDKPKIAVVYGLGATEMDSGIRARWLGRQFLKLAKDRSVKAVVFRVDSPGGDGMASDIVAEALKKCSKEKPVIVSQGQVAGSGGYWISMYGSEIVAGPNTLTGSIGVIGGWLYDTGFSSKLGMTSDLVKRGDHADLGFGVTLPFLGIEVPARNLTPDEQEKVKSLIFKMYDIFVQKVARGRGMTVEKVKEIGQGHFYSGLEGEKLGLVDEIGGLMTALTIAKQKAGIKADTEIDIEEIPSNKGLFDFGSRFSPLGTELRENRILQSLRLLSEHQGEPLPFMLPGDYPEPE